MSLSAKQTALAELMVLEPTLTNVEYAKRVGIDPKTLYKWKKTEEFQSYLHECCQLKFRSLEKLAIGKLRENIMDGNQKAIEYVLNYAGYQPAQKAEIDLRSDIDIIVD